MGNSRGHKLSEYIKLPTKRKKWKANTWRDGFYPGSVDPLVKTKENYDNLDRYRNDRV